MSDVKERFEIKHDPRCEPEYIIVDHEKDVPLGICGCATKADADYVLEALGSHDTLKARIAELEAGVCISRADASYIEQLSIKDFKVLADRNPSAMMRMEAIQDELRKALDKHTTEAEQR